MRSRIVSFLRLACILAPIASACPAQWTARESGTKARLRGVSAVGPDVVWASGAAGTAIRTLDGGTTWKASAVPDASGLDFRDVQAIDARTAVLLAIGPGEKSRIYRTTDAGESWTLSYTNRDPKGFLDAVAFWDPAHGIAMGDPVGGRFAILTTDDGGTTWMPSEPEGMPPALDGEGAFAASGTCLATQGGKDVWFGTGGARVARVFHSGDRGRTWTVHETPLRAGSPTSGVFSLAFRDPRHGVAVGGSYDQESKRGGVAATTVDGGRTWKLVEMDEPDGFRSAVAFVGPADRPRWLAVGPSGTEISDDDGRSWTSVGAPGFHAVALSGSGTAWAVGEAGRISRLPARDDRRPRK